MTVDDALDILQSALDRCRDNDIRTAGIFGTLNFLEGCTAVKCPFDNFRSALNSPRSSNQEKEALWQALNASLDGIRRCMDGPISE